MTFDPRDRVILIVARLTTLLIDLAVSLYFQFPLEHRGAVSVAVVKFQALDLERLTTLTI